MDAVDAWSDFNVAMVGATAALAGLVIVAASVNVEKIVASRSLTARLAAGIAALVLALIASALGLIPEVDVRWYGAVIIVVAAIAGVFQVHATRQIMRDAAPIQRMRVAKSALGFLPIVAYLVAGAAMLFAHPAGLVMAGVGCLVSISAAILISWIALVEVLR